MDKNGLCLKCKNHFIKPHSCLDYNGKKIECENFKNGNCKNGDYCHYFHTTCYVCSNPLAKKNCCTKVCWNAYNKSCTKKDCHFQHPEFSNLIGKKILFSYPDDNKWEKQENGKITNIIPIGDKYRFIVEKDVEEENPWPNEIWIYVENIKSIF